MTKIWNDGKINLKSPRVWAPAAGLLVLAVLIGIFAGSRHSKVDYDGTMLTSGDGLYTEFNILNSEIIHELELKEGDELECKWEIRKGKVDIVIVNSEAVRLYRGTDVDTGEFLLPIRKDDTYTITISGKDAAGEINIWKNLEHNVITGR